MHEINPTFFPVVSSIKNSTFDVELLNVLYKKNIQLCPSIEELRPLNDLFANISSGLTKIIHIPRYYTQFPICDIIPVGSYKNNTMIKSPNKILSADLVILFKNSINDSFVDKFKAVLESEVFNSCNLSYQRTEKGFVIYNELARVHALVATLPNNILKIQRVKLRIAIVDNLAATRHSMFLDEHSDEFVRMLTRLLRDIASRYEDLSGMHPWLINLLAHHASFVNVQGQHNLMLNQAFMRAIKLLAVGIFTPHGAGLNDPCENTTYSIHDYLSHEQQEKICNTAQAILIRLLNREFNHILNLHEQAEATNGKDKIELEEIKVEIKEESSDEDIIVIE